MASHNRPGRAGERVFPQVKDVVGRMTNGSARPTPTLADGNVR
jgi:hypothetical protein